MRQNGHGVEYTENYFKTRADYDRSPTKPVLDGEPIYEDHPISFDAKRHGHSVASDVRRPLYWDLFSGAFGHTYGHHSVWQMWRPSKTPINNPLMSWEQTIGQPGASQMQHARRLLESRSFLTRVPDHALIVTDRVATAIPGSGRYQFMATRDSEGRYAMVYVPVGRAFKIKMNLMRSEKVKAWWFNPRDGKSTEIGEFQNNSDCEFVPPTPGEDLDWILVLDDASTHALTPGTAK